MAISDVPIITSNGILVDYHLFFSSDAYNGLLRFNLIDNALEFISYFPDELILRQYCHRRVMKCDDKLLFAPWHGDNLHIYDLKSAKFKSIRIPHKYYEAISAMFSIGEKIYLFPVYTEDRMAEFDLRTGKLLYVMEFEDEKKIGINELRGSGNCIRIDDCVWFSYWRDTALMCWNMKTKK